MAATHNKFTCRKCNLHWNVEDEIKQAEGILQYELKCEETGWNPVPPPPGVVESSQEMIRRARQKCLDLKTGKHKCPRCGEEV